MRIIQDLMIVAILLVGIPCAVVAGEDATIEATECLSLRSPVSENVNSHLLKFDFSGIPSNATIDRAIIIISVDLDTTLATPLNLMAYPVTESWQSSDIPSEGSDIDYADNRPYPAFLLGKKNQEAEFEVTDLVQAWVSGELANNGIIFGGIEHPDSKIDIRTEKPGVKATMEIMYSVEE